MTNDSQLSDSISETITLLTAQVCNITESFCHYHDYNLTWNRDYQLARIDHVDRQFFAAHLLCLTGRLGIWPAFAARLSLNSTHDESMIATWYYIFVMQEVHKLFSSILLSKLEKGMYVNFLSIITW